MSLDAVYRRHLDITVEYDVPARMRDGTTLYADVYRPTRGGPFPVLLMRLPYDKTQAEALTYHHPAWYARQGFMVVVQDTRGRWRSEGEFYPFAFEAEDGYDTVEWAASLPGANGRVGMYGFSYVGATQLLAATMRPPSLRTICPRADRLPVLRRLDVQRWRFRPSLLRLLGHATGHRHRRAAR